MHYWVLKVHAPHIHGDQEAKTVFIFSLGKEQVAPVANSDHSNTLGSSSQTTLFQNKSVLY